MNGRILPPPFDSGLSKYYSDDPNAIIEVDFEHFQRFQCGLGGWKSAFTFVDTIGPGAPFVQTLTDPPDQPNGATWFEREVLSFGQSYGSGFAVGISSAGINAEIIMGASVTDGESYWPRIDISGNALAVTIPVGPGPTQLYFKVGISNIETQAGRATPTWGPYIDANISDGFLFSAPMPLYVQPLSDFGVTTADLENFYNLTSFLFQPTLYTTS